VYASIFIVHCISGAFSLLLFLLSTDVIVNNKCIIIELSQELTTTADEVEKLRVKVDNVLSVTKTDNHRQLKINNHVISRTALSNGRSHCWHLLAKHIIDITSLSNSLHAAETPFRQNPNPQHYP